MARFNQQSGRSPEAHAFRKAGVTDRRASLEARGCDVAAKMAQMGCGEQRAMAQLERELGLVWRAGGFGDEVRGHAEQPKLFTVVSKVDGQGWRVACAFGFKSIEEADTWRKANLKTTETRISKCPPAYVGGGYFNLNASDFVD